MNGLNYFLLQLKDCVMETPVANLINILHS